MSKADNIKPMNKLLAEQKVFIADALPRRVRGMGGLGYERGIIDEAKEWRGYHCAGNICHVAEPGEPEHVFWLGFDCAHGGDLVPKLAEHGLHCGEVYRRIGYVKAETEWLAEQLKEMR